MIFEALFDEIPKNLVVFRTNAQEVKNYNLKDGDFVCFSFVCNESKNFVFRLLIDEDKTSFKLEFIFPKWIENYFNAEKNVKRFYCSFIKIPETTPQSDIEMKNKDALNIEISFISVLEQEKLLNYSAFLLKYQVKNFQIKFHNNRLI